MKSIIITLSCVLAAAIIIICFLLSISSDRSTTYYAILEKQANEDVEFILAYLNYNNRDCISDNYHFKSDYFNEIINEIKSTPPVLFYNKLTFGLNYLEDKDIGYLMKLLGNSKCVHEVDMGLSYITAAGLAKICHIQVLNINTITINGDFSTKEVLKSNTYSNCLYKMQADAIDSKILLLTK